MATGTASIHATIEIDGQPLAVLEYELNESISELSFLRCNLVHHDQELPEASSLIGKSAKFVLESTEGGERVFVGLVVAASTVQSGDDVMSLELEIAPPLFRLAKRKDCRIFQHQTVVDIAKKVLKDAGLDAADLDWKVIESHPARDYVTQYRETDLEFLQRILSEEGIYFAVHEKDGKAITVFSDDVHGVGDITPQKILPFMMESGFEGAGDHVYRLSQTHRTRSDKTFIRQYDWQKPKLKLEANAEGNDPGAHAQEVYCYPGRLADTGTAKRYAKILLESLQADRIEVAGDSGALGLRPGLRLEVENHPYHTLNGEILVTRVQIAGSERRQFGIDGAGETQRDYGYRCSFVGVPVKRTNYRPPRAVVARTIPGLQTAMTTGASGQEIHVNEHGQVTAQFHWDRLGKRDDKSSTWMRTSQLALGGSMLLPRVNWEAVVSFNEGDADSPMVMSRFYNGVTPPPYSLPANKARSAIQTATTPGGGSSNEVRMNDTKGKEEMFFNGSKDMSVDVGNNATESVKVDQTKKIGSNHKLTISDSLTTAVGADQKLSVGGNQKLSVSKLYVDDVDGAHKLTIGGDRKMMIGGDHRRTVQGDSTETMGSNMIDLVMGAVNEATLDTMTQDIGAALVELTVGTRSLITAADRTESTGAVKAIVSAGGRGVEAEAITRMVGGAIIVSAKGDRSDKAGTTLTDTAAGAQIIKADNVSFEAEGLLSFVMGASTITLTPVSIIIAGVTLKVDADNNNLGIVFDN